MENNNNIVSDSLLFVRFEEFTSIEKVKELINQAKSNKQNLVIVVDNTKSVSFETLKKINELTNDNLLIEVIGAFDEEFMKNVCHSPFKYNYNNIYSFFEYELIIKKLDTIEAGIQPFWTDEQKLFYFIGMISDMIKYHPNYKEAESNNIRSLRGLISKKNVCAGYAIILKELCDRNGIECDYASGYISLTEKSETHAWNIVKLQGNYVGIDLTWFANRTSQGKFNDISNICDANFFINNHYPFENSKMMNYEQILCGIDSKKVRDIFEYVNLDRKYIINSKQYKRKDGTIAFISLVNEVLIGKESVYTYIYSDCKEDSDGISYTSKPPIILRTTENIFELESKIWNNEYYLANDSEKEFPMRKNSLRLDTNLLKTRIEEIINEVFSKENINSAIERGDYFLGKYISSGKTEGVFIDLDLAKKSFLKQRTIPEDDVVIEEEDFIENIESKKGYRLYFLDSYVKKYTIFTEIDLLNDNPETFRKTHLSEFLLNRNNPLFKRYGIERIGFDRSYEKEISKRLMLTKDDFKTANCKTLSLSELFTLCNDYHIEKIGGNEVIVNNESKESVDDKYLISQYKLANIIIKDTYSLVKTDEQQIDYNEGINFFYYIIEEYLKKSISSKGIIDLNEIVLCLKIHKPFKDNKFLTSIIKKVFKQKNLPILFEAYSRQIGFIPNNKDRLLNDDVKEVLKPYNGRR